MTADDSGKKEKAPAEKKTPGKKYRKKRPVPHLTELLANGSEESKGQKKTWAQLVIPPAILAMVFFLSFLLFMRVFPYLPNNRSFQLPQRNKNVPRYSPSMSNANSEQGNPQDEPHEERMVNMAEF